MAMGEIRFERRRVDGGTEKKLWVKDLPEGNPGKPRQVKAWGDDVVWGAYSKHEMPGRSGWQVLSNSQGAVPEIRSLVENS